MRKKKFSDSQSGFITVQGQRNRTMCTQEAMNQSQPENDCNYSEIRKEIEAERDWCAFELSLEKKPWKQRSWRAKIVTCDKLLAKLDEKHGRKGA